MVLLTATPRIVEGLQKLDCLPSAPIRRSDASPAANAEPRLDGLEVGSPISHGQIVDLWNQLDSQGHTAFTLEDLLRGAQVYFPPPPPKPEPTDEYKALMTRLRREEEQRSYERMVNPPPRVETFAERFPNARAFAEVNRPTRASDMGDDEVTYADVNKQLMLILNFMVSIVGVAATVWIVARWWSTPARLFLTMGASLLVGIAEVAVYSGYVWRLGEAKERRQKVKEVKEVVDTWVLATDGGSQGDKVKLGEVQLLDGREPREDTGVRRRRKEAT